MSRPENHVTRALAARHEGVRVPPLPELNDSLVSALEALYPPRCLDRDQTVEDHLRYAGKVELVVSLRSELNAILEAQRANVVDVDEDSGEINVTDAERAS